MNVISKTLNMEVGMSLMDAANLVDSLNKRGEHLVNLLNSENGAKVVAVSPSDEVYDGHWVIMYKSNGCAEHPAGMRLISVTEEEFNDLTDEKFLSNDRAVACIKA